MTKKYLVQAAAAIRTAAQRSDYMGPDVDAARKRVAEEIAKDLASVFAQANPNFNRDKFLEACKPVAEW